MSFIPCGTTMHFFFSGGERWQKHGFPDKIFNKTPFRYKKFYRGWGCWLLNIMSPYRISCTKNLFHCLAACSYKTALCLSSLRHFFSGTNRTKRAMGVLCFFVCCVLRRCSSFTFAFLPLKNLQLKKQKAMCCKCVAHSTQKM